jgi:hypothetical protein
MSRQVNFYQHPEDLRAFAEMLRKRSDIRILKHAWSSTEPEEELDLLGSLPCGSQSCDARMALIVRPEDMSALVVTHRESLGYWTADIRNSPVIEFTRCVFHAGSITPGRLYFVDHGKVIEFIKLGESLFRWIKSRYSRPTGRGFQFYRGPAITTEAEKSAVHFKPI